MKRKADQPVSTPVARAYDAEQRIRERHAGRRVLVVDDEPINLEIAQSFLLDLGLVVDTAEDGVQAVQLAGQSAYALIVMDMQMPRMDGLSLIKNLRAMPQYGKTPILMLTTESSDAMKAQGRAAGATGWLVKPFDPQKLIEVVRKVIG